MATILVVDDSAVDRRLVGGLLQKEHGWKIEYAENGVEALTHIKQNETTPDLVVTDLQMPEMDGLELVTATRAEFPDVPVILMTAFGSEMLAVEALQQGAATYVPKQQLADNLAHTAKQVLALTRADRTYARLIDCVARTEFSFVLANDPELVDALVDLAQHMVVSVGLCDLNGRLRIGVALKEALNNALYHGNLELDPRQAKEASQAAAEEKQCDLVEQRRAQSPYQDRRIFVDAKLAPEEVRFVIRDEGSGFDPAAIPVATEPGAMEPDCGRGLSLIRAFMDEVVYNDAGNELTMAKRRSTDR